MQAFTAKYRKTFGIDVNYWGEAGYTASTFVIAALEKAGRRPVVFAPELESATTYAG